MIHEQHKNIAGNAIYYASGAAFDILIFTKHVFVQFRCQANWLTIRIYCATIYINNNEWNIHTYKQCHSIIIIIVVWQVQQFRYSELIVANTS